MDFTVEEVLPEGRVVVDARELRRVVLDTGEVTAELLPPDEAELAAATFNELHCTATASVVPYAVESMSRVG